MDSEKPNGGGDTPPTIEGEKVIAALTGRPLYWALQGSSPAEAEQSAGVPTGTAVWQADVADGYLRAMVYENQNGWVLEVAHVMAGLLAADGNARAGRPPHLWELRAARARFVPGDVLLAFLIFPPDIPAPRPHNCVQMMQAGKVIGPGRSQLALV